MNDLNKILGIYDAKVNVNFVKDDDISFLITIDPKPHKCPRCNNATAKVHDYRIQKIKDIPFQNKSCTLHLKKRRYHCPNCGKHFYDRIGETISIDEFKGNVGTEKYQTIVVDPIKHKVLDILYSRKSTCLVEYFKSLDKSKRMNVKYFSCDMNKTFIDMAKTYFPNAKIVIDRYHFIRQVYWALENVRKNVQKNMSKTLRRYYKRSRHIITTRESILSEENKAALRLMLEYSEDLRKAHFIKELFIKLLDEKSYSKQRVLLHEWLLEVESSGIKEFNAAITAFRNNYKYILHSLKYRHISNGPTEGFNNKIKVLKRISYGVRNFKYFRNRILMATA